LQDGGVPGAKPEKQAQKKKKDRFQAAAFSGIFNQTVTMATKAAKTSKSSERLAGSNG
jgi:hypothetical protein